MIAIRAPRLKLLFLFALSVGMTAASAWLTLALPALGLTTVVGGVGVLFFGFAGGWILSRFFSHRISLILDRDGLIDNSSVFAAGRIPWDQISRVGITAVQNQRFLGIDVKDRTILPSATSALRRRIDEANIGIAGYPVYVAGTAIDRTLEDLQALIVQYWKEPDARAEL